MIPKNINPLRSGLIIMLAITVIGLLIVAAIPGRYKTPVEDAASMAASMQGITPMAFREAHLQQHADHLLIDMRSPEEFSRGYLPGAMNLPVEDMMLRRNLKKLRKDKVWIYCQSEDVAHQAALLLRMKGVDAHPVNTGYHHLNDLISGEGFNAPALFQSEEKIRYDYQQFFRVYEPEPVEAPVIKVIVPTPEGC